MTIVLEQAELATCVTLTTVFTSTTAQIVLATFIPLICTLQLLFMQQPPGLDNA